MLNDDFKNEKNIRLIQHLDGFSDEKEGLLFDGPDYTFKLKLTYSKAVDAQLGNVMMDLAVTTSARPEELDSVIYFQVDDEKYKFVSADFSRLNFVDRSTTTKTTSTTETDDDKEKNYAASDKKESVKTSTTTSTTISDKTLQAMKHSFEIPPSLWHKFMKVNVIKLRSYIDNEGVDVLFTFQQRNKFGDFFYTVLKNEESPSEV